MIHVTVWNEFRHERQSEEIRAIYPEGIHGQIARFLKNDPELEITLAALDDPEQGLPEEVLNRTDVLIWWGHMAHGEVSDALVERIRRRVYLGRMGLLVLHSGHHSKVFRSVVGTTGNLGWGRNQKEIVWNVNPSHPITQGVPDHFCLPCEELYCEPFYIGQPDELVFTSWFEDGYILRSGCVFLRGAGKIFYFQPGHEECRSFYDAHVQRVIQNAVHYVCPADFAFPVRDKAPCVHPHKVTDEFDT